MGICITKSTPGMQDTDVSPHQYRRTRDTRKTQCEAFRTATSYPLVRPDSVQGVYDTATQLLSKDLETVLDLVWDKQQLKRHPELTKALDQFLRGKIGCTLSKIDFKGKRFECIHRDLICAGFTHQKRPLVVDAKAEQPVFWLRNGLKTLCPKGDLLSFHEYCHDDGSTVFLTPNGIPGAECSGHPRLSQPHVSMGVKRRNNGEIGTSDGPLSILFRVSAEGYPLPRDSSPSSGLASLPKAIWSSHLDPLCYEDATVYQQVWEEAVNDKALITL